MSKDDKNAEGVAKVMKEVERLYPIMLRYVASRNYTGLTHSDALHECFIQRIMHIKNPKHIWSAIRYGLRDLQRDNFDYRRKNKIIVDSYDQIRNKFDKENYFKDGLACEDKNLLRLENKELLDLLIEKAFLTDLQKEILYMRFYMNLTWQELSKKLGMDCPSMINRRIRNSRVFYHYKLAINKLKEASRNLKGL